jgi:uncharacterized protein (TIGR02145 family)
MKTIAFLFILFLSATVGINAQESWESYTTANSSIPFNKINRLEVADDGSVWIGNDNSGNFSHLAVFNGSTWQGYFTSTWINDVDYGSDGSVWTLHEGYLKKLNGSTWNQYAPPGLLSWWAGPLYAEGNGCVWVKSDASLFHFNGTNWIEYTISNGLPSSSITSITGNSQGIFLGTQDKGLVFYNGTAWTTYNTINSDIPSDNVTAIIWKNGQLWFTTNNQYLGKFENNQFTLYSSAYLNSPQELDIDLNGNVWVAAYGTGVVKFDGSTFSLYNHVNQPLLDTWDQILSIGVDGNNDVWIGNRNTGLVVYHTGGTPNNFDPNDTIRVFFLGNSFTAANDLPGMVYQLADAAGIPVFIDSYTPGGQFSINFIQDPIVYAKFHSQPWDYVVIQDNQGAFVNYVPYIGLNYLNANIQLCDSVTAICPCAKVILFAGWAGEGGYPQYIPGDNTQNCIGRILGNVVYLNTFVDQIIAPIGEAWIQSLNEQPQIDLYSPDGNHPSAEGSFAAATVIFSVIVKANPASLNYSGGINEADAQYLGTIAYEIVTDQDNFSTYSIGIVSPQIVFDNNMLSTPAPYDYYQWFLNGELIPGADNPVLGITEEGEYSLVVMGAGGCIQTSFPYLYYIIPAAEFSYFADELTVLFYNNSANATSYQWNFGDNSNSAESNPVHIYQQYGTYFVSLTAYGTSGSSLITHELTLSSVPLPFQCGDLLPDLRDGQMYPTVQIGNQCWMAKNLNTGIMILESEADAPTNNGIIEKFCYDYNSDNCVTYGGLYQFDEMMNYLNIESTQGICPAGWHIPSVAEYDTLIAGFNPNTVAIDLQAGGYSGFEALASGYCYNNYQEWVFGSLGQYGVLRTSSPSPSGTDYSPVFYYYPGDGVIYTENMYKKSNGYSVRCVWNGESQGTDGEIKPDELLKLYPNPVKDILNIECNLKEKSGFSLYIYNSAGQEMYRKHFVNINGRIMINVDTKNFSTGSYIARMLYDNGSFAEKQFVK